VREHLALYWDRPAQELDYEELVVRQLVDDLLGVDPGSARSS